ncbi:MAG TPA: hypothetical protein VID75_12600 [Acidimicrobiales bacterium]|jgi:Mce-associated membrane protein
MTAPVTESGALAEAESTLWSPRKPARRPQVHDTTGTPRASAGAAREAIHVEGVAVEAVAPSSDIGVPPVDAGDGAPRWAARSRVWAATHAAAVIAGIVAVALAVCLVLALLALGNSNAVAAARVSALGSARTDAVALAGYDYRHLNRDFGAVLANSTPSFQRRFGQASDALKSTLTKFHATAAAKVVSEGLVWASTSRAVVLVFLDQTVTNSTNSKPTTDRSQVEITLVNDQGRWLIDQVSLL